MEASQIADLLRVIVEFIEDVALRNGFIKGSSNKKTAASIRKQLFSQIM